MGLSFFFCAKILTLLEKYDKFRMNKNRYFIKLKIKLMWRVYEFNI